MSWWHKRLVGFDLETTSAEPGEARIVSAAIVEVGGGPEPHFVNWLVNPGVPIPEEATGIHGISDADVAKATKAADAVREIVEVLDMRAIGSPVVAFNARYDLTVLDREAVRYEVEEWPRVRDGLVVVDPMVIDKHLDRFRKGSRKLDAICATYGAVLDEAHEASADALAACRAAWVLGAKGKVIRKPRNWGGHYEADMHERAALEAEWEAVRGDLALLHAAQVGWAAFQAEGLAEHFRATGREEEAARVVGDWPIEPVPVAA